VEVGVSHEEPVPFGEYQLVERIAVGGMAEVWRGRAEGVAGFSKTLVIKKILDKLARDEEFVRLFIDEARIAVQLQHANIVQVFDLGTADGTLFMAMEYVQGLDLDQLVKKLPDGKPFPVSLALFIVGEVLKALRFAHEREGEEGQPLNIVHCDISPHNVLISLAGEVKITDFGISRAAFQASSLHETVRGKYAYMSPEQIDGAALDGRSDLFSLGIMMWEVLTGKRLFKGRTRDETSAKVRKAEVPSPRQVRPEISEELEQLILRALARDPAHRYADASQMLEHLSLLMVREGHRTANHDMAQFLGQLGVGPQGPKVVDTGSSQQTVVVMAAEAVPPASAGGALLLDDIADEWADVLARSGAQLWERDERSVLAVWPVTGELGTAIPAILDAVGAVRAMTRDAGFQLAAGLAPGRARIFVDSRRPSRGWELAGPFYLARWMMNLSAQRGRPLVTRALAQPPLAQGAPRPERVGRVAVEEGRFIQLFELPG
jgi:tRNA A-37 threonylcarbamoyl transferase component Bud32